MKKMKKRILSIALALTLAFGCCAVTGTVDTQASSKNYMDKLNLKELKANKKYKIQTSVKYTNKKQSSKFYITDLEKTKAKKKGYNKLTFRFIIEQANINFSSISKSKLLNSIYNETDIGQSGYFYAIVDATTGKDIEDDNDVDVTCTASDWKYAYYPKYHFSSEGYDYWYRAVKKVRISATVVYPEDYEDLGIIIGMYDSSKCKDGKNERAFWSGTKAFGQTNYYKKAKNTCYYKKIK